MTCKVCRQNLSVAKFSNSQLKKLRKAKAKGKPVQIACTTCTGTNKPNKGESGSVANNQQRSSKANASSSQPAAATRSTHDSTAKSKSRVSEKQPKEVMTAAAKRVIAQRQPLAAAPATAPTLKRTHILQLTHNCAHTHTRIPDNSLNPHDYTCIYVCMYICMHVYTNTSIHVPATLL